MIKNTASQSIGAQMITAADGTAFTGSVTVSVTGDSGTQATGSVGSGACAHEGGGYHSYRPAQAETNYDHVAFTFAGTGAIPATVQVFTRAGDAFTRLGAPAGASMSADIAAVKVDTAAILVDTGTTLDARIPAALTADGNIKADTLRLGGTLQTARDVGASVLLSAGTGTGQLDFTSGVVKANLAQILGTALTETAGQIAAAFKKFFNIATPAATMDHLVLVDTATTATTATNLTNSPTAGDFTATMKTSIGTVVAASAVASVTGNVGGNVAGSVGSVAGAVGSVTGAVGSVTGSVGSVAAGGITASSVATGAIDADALSTDAVTEIADAVLDRNMATGTDSGSPTVRTVRQALRASRNRVAIAAGTATVYKEDDTTASWTAAVTTTAGNPVSEIDPASA